METVEYILQESDNKRAKKSILNFLQRKNILGMHVEGR